MKGIPAILTLLRRSRWEGMFRAKMAFVVVLVATSGADLLVADGLAPNPLTPGWKWGKESFACLASDHVDTGFAVFHSSG